MGSLGCEDGWSLSILVLCETFMFIVRDFRFKKIQVYTVMKHRSIIQQSVSVSFSLKYVSCKMI